MDLVSLADARARLSELLDRVEAGDTVEVSPRGWPGARGLRGPPPRPPGGAGRPPPPHPPPPPRLSEASSGLLPTP